MKDTPATNHKQRNPIQAFVPFGVADNLSTVSINNDYDDDDADDLHVNDVITNGDIKHDHQRYLLSYITFQWYPGLLTVSINYTIWYVLPLQLISLQQHA
jgi:hypothetical protein